MSAMQQLGERRIAVIIEDDADIRHLLEAVLGQAGFETISVGNGLDGIQAVLTHDPIVTTLDVSLPGIDGFETAKRIRAVSSTYLVMLTARDEEIDMLQGLDSGADDYLTKPFRPRELRARIEAMLRRPRSPGIGTGQALADAPIPVGVGAGQQGALQTAASYATASLMAGEITSESQNDAYDSWLRHNGLRLNVETRIAMLDEAEVDLTRSEFDLLAGLLESGRRVRSKQDLALLLRAESYVTNDYVSETDKRTVEVHVTNLRRKLNDNVRAPRFVETVRGVGYRLSASQS
ncbi:MAG: two-component system response regulator [Cryobacterium sp.]|jgi:two-component system OmpR family response regulator|nr:two-component system response regulator [Cryobacterium sp.]